MAEEKPVTEARSEFTDLVNQAFYNKTRFALVRRGKIMAAIVSPEDLVVLENLIEHMIDLTKAEPAPAGRADVAVDTLRIAAEHKPGTPPNRPGFRA
jgi:hypothetical protein